VNELIIGFSHDVGVGVGDGTVPFVGVGVGVNTGVELGVNPGVRDTEGEITGFVLYSPTKLDNQLLNAELSAASKLARTFLN
jgi:opacity protein-like surface antigen